MCRLWVLVALSASAPSVSGLVLEGPPKKGPPKKDPPKKDPPKNVTDVRIVANVTGVTLMTNGASGMCETNGTGASPPKVAVFTVLVNAQEHYKKEDMVPQAAHLLCSARRLGSKLPFHLIHGGGLEKQEMRFLETLGWIVQDERIDRAFFRSLFKPVFKRTMAARQNRRWNDGNAVQRRYDGWATYFKFNAWTNTQYDHVVLSDVDVVFNENPDPVLGTIPEGDVFQSYCETEKRHNYTGMNTHMMILKPALKIFKQLCMKANMGDYVPYTNTEQDILEDLYPAERFATGNMTLDSLNHTHQPQYPAVDAAELAKLIEDPEANCEKLRKVAGEPAGFQYRSPPNMK